MTEISFYHLTKTPVENALPKLLEKIVSSGNRAVLMVGEEDKLKKLDDSLWISNDFLPHGKAEDDFPENQPIYLTLSEENPNGATFLVAVGGVEPSFIGDFERCLDVFDGANENEVQFARARWKKYKSVDGNSLSYWKQDDNGKWQKEA